MGDRDSRKMLWNTSREILLNVYDLHESNDYLYSMGLGFYHTGIEIAINQETVGYEYSFSTLGISKTRPRLMAFGKLRTQIKLGTHTGNGVDIYAVINRLGDKEFGIGTYDVTKHNCNHFTDALAFALFGVHIPGWINRLAHIGAPFYSTPKIQDDTSVASEEKEEPVNEDDWDNDFYWLCGCGLGVPAPKNKTQRISN
jgi:hypothetical protein